MDSDPSTVDYIVNPFVEIRLRRDPGGIARFHCTWRNDLGEPGRRGAHAQLQVEPEELGQLIVRLARFFEPRPLGPGEVDSPLIQELVASGGLVDASQLATTGALPFALPVLHNDSFSLFRFWRHGESVFYFPRREFFSRHGLPVRPELYYAEDLRPDPERGSLYAYFRDCEFRHVQSKHDLYAMRDRMRVQGFTDGMTPAFICLAHDLLPIAPAGGDIVEVGSLHGSSAIVLASVAERWNGPAVHCVDTWELRTDFSQPGDEVYAGFDLSEAFEQFQRNVSGSGLAHRITPFKGTSGEFAAAHPGLPISFLYLDAGHSYEWIKTDFESLFPRLLPGGVLLIDDAAGWRAVPQQRFTRELLGHPGLRDLQELGGLVWGIKA